MSTNHEETEEETEATESGDYVTREELLSTVTDAVKEAFASLNPLSDDHSDETEEEETAEEPVSFSAADVERIAEQKVREAMKALGAKKPAPKKAAPAKKAAPKKVEPESTPVVAGKKSLRSFLWGTESE